MSALTGTLWTFLGKVYGESGQPVGVVGPCGFVLGCPFLMFVTGIGNVFRA